MTLSQQCVSLDIAKRLKELGVPQESLFFYAKSPENKFRLYPLYFDPETSKKVKLDKKEKEYSAFTCSELGEMLPKNIQLPVPQREGKGCLWRNEEGNHLVNTEADARGKMLVYLYENGLIK